MSSMVESIIYCIQSVLPECTVADQSILGKGWADYRECVAGISLYDECLSWRTTGDFW